MTDCQKFDTMPERLACAARALNRTRQARLAAWRSGITLAAPPAAASGIASCAWPRILEWGRL